MGAVTRSIVIAGLVLLVLLLPLAALPVAGLVLAAPCFLALALAHIGFTPRSVAPIAFAHPRAPPSC
jgi:hypothetical protein